MSDIILPVILAQLANSRYDLTQQTITLGIIRTSSIGDVVLSTAALDYLTKLEAALPNWQFKIYFISKKPCLDLLESGVSRVEILDIESGEAQIKDTNFLKSLQILIDLQDNPRSKMLGRYYGKVTGRLVMKVNKYRWQRTLSVLKARWYGRSRELPSLDHKPLLQYQIVVQTISHALERWGLDLKSSRAIEAKDTARPSLISHGMPLSQFPEGSGPWIALGPGASFETKKYPEHEFREVLKKLATRLPVDLLPNLVFLGDLNDQKSAEEIMSSLDWPQKTLNLSGKTTLSETKEILAQVSLILCNDTSLAHIAEALGTPAGVIFGPTSESFGFIPFSEESHAFSAPIGCRPCSKHGRSPCRFGDKACFTSIPKSIIVDWILTRLSALRHQKAPQIIGGHER